MPNPHREGGGGGIVQPSSEPPSFSRNPSQPQNSAADELVADAIGLAGFQAVLESIAAPDRRKQTIMRWYEFRWITGDQTTLLILENDLVAA